MKSTLLQTIGAVAAGIAFTIVLTTLLDIVLHAVHVYPPLKEPIGDGLALLASSYRLVIGIAGAWLTACLAPDHPMRHVLILGVTGTLFAVAGAVATWNLGLGPHWYPVSLAVLALPQSWFGGWLHVRGRAAKPA